MLPRDYWVRRGAAVEGPFGAAELRRRAGGGLLEAGHEVSVDRERWVPASRVRGPRFGGEFADEPEPKPARVRLDDVRAYVPSGRCGRPLRLLLLLPVGVLAGIVGCMVGALLGTVIGWLFAWVYTIAVTMILGPGVRQVALTIGPAVGGGVGLGLGEALGIVGVGMAASYWARNRNRALAGGFGGLAGFLVMLVYGAVWTSSPEQAALLGPTLGLGLLIQAGGGLAAGAALTAFIGQDFYCEKCGSFAEGVFTTRFAAPVERVLELARGGDVGSLSNLARASESLAESSLTLGICAGGCRASLELCRIERVPAQGGGGKPQVRTETIVFGVIGPKAAAWKAILAGV